MEGDNIFQMNSMNIWGNMEFKRNVHVVIPHIMELLKGRTCTFAKITHVMLKEKNLPK